MKINGWQLSLAVLALALTGYGFLKPAPKEAGSAVAFGPKGGTLLNLRGSFECTATDQSGEKFSILSDMDRFDITDLRYASWSGLNGRTMTSTTWHCMRINVDELSPPLARITSDGPDLSGPGHLVSGEWFMYSPLDGHPNDDNSFGIVLQATD